MTDTAPVTQALPQTESAGAARFQAASVAAQAANAIKSAPSGTPVTTADPPTAPRTFVDELKEDAEGSMNALESRITELEAVVHRLASAADGEHPGIGAWLSKVGSRLRALL